MERPPSRAWLLLPLVLAGAAIVPHAWLSEHSAAFAAVFRPFCAAVGAEGGHATVFAVLGTALLVAVPALRRDLLAYLLILVVIGVGQECAQLLWKARASGFDELHDLSIDLSAGFAIWAVAGALRLRPLRQCLQILGKRG